MRVPVHRADTVLFDACRTAFSGWRDKLLLRGADRCGDALLHAAAHHPVMAGASGALFQLPRFTVVSFLVAVETHGFLLLRPAALRAAAVGAGLLVFRRTLKWRAHRPLADDCAVLTLAVRALVIRPRRLIVVDVVPHTALSVQIGKPLATAALGATCPGCLGDAAWRTWQYWARLLSACHTAVLAEADNTGVPFVRRYGVSFGVLPAVYHTTFAVRATLPLRWISRILAIHMAVDSRLSYDAGLTEESTTRILGIGPFLRAGVEPAFVDAAFADVAALIPLGLLQEVAASWQRAGLASALYHAVLALTGDTLCRDARDVRDFALVEALDRISWLQESGNREREPRSEDQRTGMGVSS